MNEQHPVGGRRSRGFTLVELPAVSRRGFTLVELMTVIAIIGILIALVLGVAGYASRKAAASRAEAEIEKIKQALEEYRAQYGRYPTNAQPYRSANLTANLWVKPQREGLKPFLVMKGWSVASSNYAILDPWGNEYQYLHDPDGFPVYATNNNSKFGYDIWSFGPNNLDGADDVKSWGGN